MTDGIPIEVIGASKATGELQKVAGGYRAIGHAADQAAHSAEKVHGNHAAHERQRAKAFSGAFLGGRGGAGGALGHIAHLGAAGGAAYVAMEAAAQLAEVMKRGTEEALENIKFQREVVRDIASIQVHRESAALAAVESMDVHDKAVAERQGGTLANVIKQAEAYERIKKSRDEATRGMDADAALHARMAEDANPALSAVSKKLQPKKDELDDLEYEANNEGKIGRFLSNLDAITHLQFSKIGHASAEDRYADAAVQYQEQSSEAISQALEADRARKETVEAAMLLKESATALHSAATRSQSSVPGN